MNREGRPVRVVVVDDSRLMRAMLTGALEAEGDIRVAAAARDASEARRCVRELSPDVITLDVEMPGMDGLGFLEKLMTLRPTPVVMVSSLTARGADETIAALQLGAVDALPKPGAASARAAFAQELRERVRLASSARVARLPASAARPDDGRRVVGAWTRRLVVIGASTGGVGALSRILPRLPARFPPILVAQHMPESYTARFADRLARQFGRDVAEARRDEPLADGVIRIAPGSSHLSVVSSGGGFTTRLAEGPPVSGHRPSVDVLFASAAEAAGPQAVAALLTGMGRDGAAGLRAVRRRGGLCLAQGPESCVVYGMPRAAVALGAVDEELEIDALADRLRYAVQPPGFHAPATQETQNARSAIPKDSRRR